MKKAANIIFSIILILGVACFFAQFLWQDSNSFANQKHSLDTPIWLLPLSNPLIAWSMVVIGLLGLVLLNKEKIRKLGGDAAV